MKTFQHILVLVMALLAPQITQAQGTTYLSGLPGGAVGTYSVASNTWYAIGFETGNDANGYLLNSIQLQMYTTAGNPNDFSATLYSSTKNTPSEFQEMTC